METTETKAKRGRRPKSPEDLKKAIYIFVKAKDFDAAKAEAKELERKYNSIEGN